MNSELHEIMLLIARGNPGALTVLMQLSQMGAAGVSTIIKIGDLGLRGSSIWVAYKDFAKQDIQALIIAIMSEDPVMLEAVRLNLTPEEVQSMQPDLANKLNVGRKAAIAATKEKRSQTDSSAKLHTK